MNDVQFFALREAYVADHANEKNFEAVIRYLNDNEHFMPLPRYKYDPEDKTTWKFIPNPVGKGSVLNPKFSPKMLRG